MILNTKLAFEIWAGIVVLIVVIGGVAGMTLMFGNDAIPLTRTQVYNPSPTPFFSESVIQNAASGIADTIQGGTKP